MLALLAACQSHNQQPRAQLASSQSSGAEHAASSLGGEDSGLSARQKAAIGVADFGIASLGVAVGFSLVAQHKHDRSGCARYCETDADSALNREARQASNLATAAYALSGAAIVASAFMYFWPKATAKGPTPQVTAEGGRGWSVGMHGRF